MGKNWYVKILFLLISLVGVIWMMNALKSGSYYKDANSPVQMLLGGESQTATPNPSATPANH